MTTSDCRAAGTSRQAPGRPVVGSLRKTVVLCLSCFLLCAATVAPLAAQVQAPLDISTPRGIKYGKWAAVAMSAGLTAVGIHVHRGADNDFRTLADYCRGGGACVIGPDGRYTDPAAESLYRAVVRGDRAARAWLMSGQAALVTSAILFVLELKRERGPANIPYSGLIVEPGVNGSRFGLRLTIGR